MSKTHINLLTADLGGRAAFPFKKLALPLALALPLLVVAMLTAVEFVKSRSAQSRAQQLTQKQDALRQELAGLLGEVEAVRKEQEARIQAEDQRLAAVKDLTKGRVAWSEVLREVSFLVPEGVYLSGLQSGVAPVSLLGAVEKEVRFHGVAPSHGSVTRFIAALETSQHFTQISLNYAQQGDSSDQIDFEIVGRLRSEKG